VWDFDRNKNAFSDYKFEHQDDIYVEEKISNIGAACGCFSSSALKDLFPTFLGEIRNQNISFRGGDN
jgi:hypothetical protein